MMMAIQEQENSTPKSSNLLKTEDLQISRTELCFVTSVDLPSRTFFAQLCKFSNEELVQFNKDINNACDNAPKDRKDDNSARGSTNKFHRGDLVCAKYSRDGYWYRAIILSRDSQTKLSIVYFIDYGNLQTVDAESLVKILPSELPNITRPPFGISCFFEGSGTLNQTECENLLECLSQNYLMIRVLERQTSLQWLVDVPKNAYNRPFWDLYHPDETARKNINQ